MRNVNGERVQGTTNVINGTDTYIATDSMGNVVEVINHDAAHQNGQGEAAADVMGQTGNSAFNLGKWANSGAIAEERTTIKPKPITAANDAKAQQEQLASDNEKLEAQQDVGDAFENDDYSQRNGRWGNSADHALYNKANKEYKNNKTKQDQFISGYRSAEGDAFIAPVKDAMSAVAQPIQTVTSLYDMLKSPIDSTVAIAISAKDWYTVYNAAKINDPRLYGQMKAQLDANLGFTGATVIIGGSAVNAIKASRVASKLNTNAIKDANKANKNNPPHVSVGDEPYVAPKNTTGNFQTHGVTLKDVPKSVQKTMMDDIRASGDSKPRVALEQYVESGKTVPIPMIANQNTRLYKLVDAEGRYPTPSQNTAYWIDQKQYNLVKAHPDRANDILGLPEGSQANSFNVFEMQPKPGKKPRIYQSSIATTTNPSGLTNVGNATQTIVPNWKLWSEPKKIKDVMKVK